MGTRGLLGFIIRSSQRHAAYNHFDSYPTGLGKKIVEFILSLTTEEYDIMARLVSEITWVEYESTPSLDLQERYQNAGFANITYYHDGTASKWHCLLHNTQGAPALRAIRSGALQHMVENISFLEEGMFCEWSYFIDFEGRKLETWEDTQKVDVVSFETLVKVGKGYMDHLEE
ncbi:hypothetical protein GALMADRAFT_254952 [Galerina marginata CBS 339.88]|uniref:Uncharacterized protein n=1 Tax=Galerina marginata (strain CBS 339.88) TaxID=685588 RepID=A0A067SGT2_GALM3|nr:hypothetical protein GALMADRAFT_254952 [Galerina marginata CBS 339.88]